MKTKTTILCLAAGLACVASSLATAAAVNLDANGYAETFDGMGAAGRTPSEGWNVYTGNSGTSNSTWTTSIRANGANSVASMTLVTTQLSLATTPTGTGNNGFNAALSAEALTDRVLATSPTTVSGAALQLSLVNTTGYGFDRITLSYDTVRYGAASSANELPGYGVFLSLDGQSWSNVAALNPTLSTFPNSAGVTSVTNFVVDLGATVANSQNFYLRWVDDNARQTSPDQIIGLNNVSVTAVPEPGTYALMLAGLALTAFTAQRRTR